MSGIINFSATGGNPFENYCRDVERLVLDPASGLDKKVGAANPYLNFSSDGTPGGNDTIFSQSQIYQIAALVENGSLGLDTNPQPAPAGAKPNGLRSRLDESSVAGQCGVRRAAVLGAGVQPAGLAGLRSGGGLIARELTSALFPEGAMQ